VIITKTYLIGFVTKLCLIIIYKHLYNNIILQHCQKLIKIEPISTDSLEKQAKNIY
jgi:hypothetical protein